MDNFFTDGECDGLVSKMEQSADKQRASSEKLQRAGERTSLSVIPRNDEVAGLRQRLASLARVELSQLQPLKVTRYDAGGVFLRHTDCTVALGRGADGGDPRESGGRDPARCPNRFCTVLVYLNDVAQGGRTCWRWTGADPAFYDRLRVPRGRGWRPPRLFGSAARRTTDVCVRPRKGMAVVHFPCTSPGATDPLLHDPNADHESEATLERKYVCQQFIWSACMDDDRVDQRVRARFERFVAAQPQEPLSPDMM